MAPRESAARWPRMTFPALTRPELAAYAGGHVGFYWSKDARRMVDEAVTRWLAPGP
jgi:hypothetical protein